MTELEKRKERGIFKLWKLKTSKEISPLIVIFFSQENPDTDIARKVGQILDKLNNPYFDILDERTLKHLDDITIIAVRVILEIQVDEFKEYMKKYLRSKK